MPVVASATLEVTPVLSGAQESLTNQLAGIGEAAGEQAGAKSGSSFAGSMAKGIAGGSALVAGAVAGAGAAMIGAANKTAEYGDQIDKASQKLGVSAEFYQEWEAVMQHSGTSMDSMGASFKKLATASQDASDDQVAAFQKLGLSMDEVANMSTEDLFTSVITGLQGMEEGTERTALATELLGRGAMDMGALLNTSSEDTQAMIDRVHELGGVMSDDAVAASAQYEDSLQDMQTALSGVGNGIMVELLPSLSGLMEKVSDFVTNADLSPLTDILGTAVEALGGFIDSLDIESAGEVFNSVMAGIGEAVSLAWDVISTIFTALSEGIATVAEAFESDGADMSGVWDGISAAVSGAAGIISEAITVIADIIAWVVEQVQTDGTLFNLAWENMQTAVQTAADVIDGIVKMISALIDGDWTAAWEAAQGIVDSVWDAIMEILSNDWEAIKSLATTVWEAIKSAVTGPIEAAKTALSSAWESVKSTATQIWNELKDAATTTWSALKSAVLDPITEAKETLSDLWDSVTSTAENVWNDITSTAEGAWESIKDAITGPIDEAKDTISGILDNILSFFPLSIGRVFSNISLPHFNVDPGAPPFGIAGRGRAPSFDVDWYARAMNDPYMFQNATLFGAGEAGDEILYGREALMDDIRDAVSGRGGVTNYITVNGASDPEAWASKAARRMKLNMRMA